MGQIRLLSEDQKIEHWRSRNLWLVSLFYFFQGIYFPGTAIYVFVAMGSWDVPAWVQTTVMAILGLPLYVAFLPGLISDRVPIARWGRRKPYIILGGLLYIFGYALLIANQRFGTIWVGALVVCLIASLLVDTCLDALTVDITPQGRIAQMQSAARASRLVGAGLISLAVPLLGPRLGWQFILILMAIFSLLQTLAAMLFKDIPLSHGSLRVVQAPVSRMFRQVFRNRLVWFGLLFYFFYPAASGFGTFLNIYLLTELGWSKNAHLMQVYAVLLLVGNCVAVFGALLVGRLLPKVLLTFRFFASYLAVCWILLMPWLLVHRSHGNIPLIFLAQILSGVFSGFGSVLAQTLQMKLSPKAFEGFIFALLGSAGAFGTYILQTKTVTAFTARLGGLIPAHLALLPYAFLCLLVLRYLFKTLDQPDSVEEALPVVA